MKTKTSTFAVLLTSALMLGALSARADDATNSPSDSTNYPAIGNGTNAADADNSARNVRDRHDKALTPGDQGNTKEDIQITRKIRRALVNDKHDYSITAKNIKIITVNGQVTLRGPVKTDAEKSGIIALAKGIAGETSVTDQLEVKTNP